MPLDGSEFAERVLPLAAEIATAAGARLRFALVHTPHPVIGGDAGPVPISDIDLRAKEGEYLTGLCRRVGLPEGLQVDQVQLEGDPGPALEGEVRRGQDDLVVMATHGRGTFSRMWLGSVADFLVRHLEVPVLLLRPDGLRAEGEGGPTDFPFGHVLIPLDGSELAERILPPALELMRLSTSGPSRVTLLTVVEPVLGGGEAGLPFAVPLDPTLLQEHRAIAEGRLSLVAQRLAAQGVTVDTQVVSATGAGAAIAAEAERVGARLIAMTTHGERGLRRLVLGSVADKVVRSSHIPTLVFRPPPVVL